MGKSGVMRPVRTRERRRWWYPAGFALAGLLSILGCSDADDVEPVEPVTDGLPESCNPLRSFGACLLPFPSAVFEEEDASTGSGYRVALTPEVMPKSATDEM